MKKLKLIYNPHAGDKNFKDSIDVYADIFQRNGYETHLYRTRAENDTAGIAESLNGDYDAFITAGGDGTLNQTVNAMMAKGLARIPIGIIPAGTANDFASYIKMPTDYAEAARVIMEGRVLNTDLGRVNGRYFINVCGAGLFTNISQQVDKQFKDLVGKLAYYLKGIEQMPNFTPFPARIITEGQTLECELFLFVALNGGGAGGLEGLSPQSRIDDGMLDFLAVKAVSIKELAALLINLLRGELLSDESVIFLRGDKFNVEYINESARYETDIDGERGPDMPVEITCAPGAVRLIVPGHYR